MASGRSTNQVIPLFPEGYLQALNAGKELAQKEKWEQAIACYREAIELNPNGADVYHCLGDAAVKLSRVQEAIAAYQKAVELKPEWGEVYEKLAQLLQDENYRCEEISSPRRRRRKMAIDPALPHYNLGLSRAKQEDFAGAVEAYKKAIAANPNLARAHHGLGEALSHLERWEEAVEAYRSAIGLEPDFSWSHNSLGDALSRLERWEEAVEAYRSAIGLNPDFVWSHYNLAEIFVKMSCFHEAILTYKEAVKLQPNLLNVNEKIGDLLKREIQVYTSEVLEFYTRAISQNQDDIELCHKALEIQPDNAELYFNLCQALVQKDELDEAITFYNMGLQAATEMPKISVNFDLMELGNKCIRKGNFKAAILFYKESQNYNPDNDFISWQLQNAIAIQNREFAYPIEIVEYLRLREPKSLTLKTSDEPVISIVIPVYNQILHTYNCLRSLAETLDGYLPFEVIVMDDHSSDNTQEVLDQISGIRSIINEQNLGFIGSCNRGASLARGDYLVLLNNDTVVMPNCFQEMLNTFQQIPNAGLVGAKLLYPNGKLQEAGGILWQDGSAWNYGRFDHPNKPEYCYLREVDYCSAAGIMIPTKLWNQIGGFDVRYKPAYYEDTDLAFEVRKAGYNVLYQPLAKIVHFEGISSGKDVKKGVKKYQILNHQKFIQKWRDVLKAHRPNGVEPHLERERTVQKRLLMIDACMLTPDQDSGSVTAFNLIKIFQTLNYKVTFAPDNLLYVEKYTENLQRLGVECLYCSYVTSIQSHLEAYGNQYDIVYIARLEFAEKHIDNVRQFAPQATVIYDTVDLHYLRETREAQLKNSFELSEKAMKTKERELALMAKADCTLVVSMMEKQMLERENPDLKNIEFFNMPRDIYGQGKGFEDRKNILFIGGFQHPPNIDAVLYFVQDVFPLIKQKIDNIKIFVIGSKAPEEILSLSSDDVVITGYVPDVSEYFNNCKLSVAPLRYGAGIKGKILTSLSYSLPVVATSIAAEGMGIQDGYDVLIGDTAESFAQQVANLYSDRKLWEKISHNSLETISRQYSIEAVTHKFEQLFKNLYESKK